MNAKEYISACIGTVILLIQMSTPFAHHNGEHAVTLNTNDKWDDCAMAISPNLTQSDWKIFTKDIASMLYFRPTAGAKTLGVYKVDIGLEYGITSKFKDYDPAWNNTFSHPEEDHWLTDNHFLEIPFLSARMGISEKMDFGLGFAKNIEANYGWLSADIKYAITKMKGYDIATRASYTSLIGVADFDINQGAVDFIISKSFFSFNPYVGVTAVYTTSNETTSKVVLERIHNMAGETILGATYQWKYLNVAAEVDFARVNMYSLKIGAIF